MKEANLLSITSAYNELTTDLFESYLAYHKIKMKVGERKDLEIFTDHLKSTRGSPVRIFDKYFIGYTIPQIAKEFDLLRIGKNTIVNIELKRSSTPDKIRTQLIRNKYYLSFLNKEMYNFTYISSEKKLYCIDNNQKLYESDIKHLISIISDQEVEDIKDINSHFNPSHYLVSPFNATNEFINGKYFLTNQQEEIKTNIFEILDSPNYAILSVKGKAGTGKTLLTYDIAKEYNTKNKRSLIIHSGMLNHGHNTLRDEHNWEILPASSTYSINFSKYKLVVVDEAQRIYPEQLEHIISQIKKFSSKCIFSYDGRQTLKAAEILNNNAQTIENIVTSEPFELTSKIRTNKEIASFIRCLFSKKAAIEKHPYSNVELNYFNDYTEAKAFILHQKTNNWKVINFTPSKFTTPYDVNNIDGESDNAHKVIGQEYDNVIAIIDNQFCYKSDRLSTSYNDQSYYHPTKMLFQIVSRTRLKLNVVIIQNKEILERCLTIVKQ